MSGYQTSGLKALYRSMLGRPGYPYLPYNHRRGVIFLHVPRTGGTTLLESLGGTGLPRYHATWQAYAQCHRACFDSYFKFAVVRNPWDRLVSVYYYLKGGGNGTDDRAMAALLTKRYDSFAKFVGEYLNEHHIHEHTLFRPQYLFLSDTELRPVTNHLVRYESYSQNLQDLSPRLGIDLTTVRRSNASLHRPYRDEYVEVDHIEKVGRLYSRDCRIFSYEF